MKKLMIVMSLFIGITFSCKKETPQPQDKQTIQTPPPPTNDTVPVTDSIQDSLETIDFYFDIIGSAQFNIVDTVYYTPFLGTGEFISPHFPIVESNNTSHTTWQGKSGEKIYYMIIFPPGPKTLKWHIKQNNNIIFSDSVFTEGNITKIDSVIIL